MFITEDSLGIGNFLVKYCSERKYLVIGCNWLNVNLCYENYKHFVVDGSKEEEKVNNLINKLSIKKLGEFKILIKMSIVNGKIIYRRIFEKARK